jgi:acyl-CoA synthetase (AMP-forming)/AMP-acid ligase II
MKAGTSTAVNDESLNPTPTEDSLPRRFSDFATLGEALDYAARGVRGLNFHDARGKLARPYPFAELRADAIACARRLIAQGVAPQDRIALIAETGPEFAALFFGAVYAGAWPVPLPLPTSFGGRESYVDQLKVQLGSCDPRLLLFPEELASMAADAVAGSAVAAVSFASLLSGDAPEADLPAAEPDARTRSPISNIPAARRAFRMAWRSRTGRCSTISRPIRTGWRSARPIAASHGCPGIMTWGSSAASCRRSPTRSQPIISRPKISPAARSPGSI